MDKTVYLTVDVESDWGGRSSPHKCRGVKEVLPILLEILNGFKINSTFFVSAELIEYHSRELKEIARFNHEIASHGFHHIPYDKLSEKDFAFELNHSKELLEQTFGRPVVSFRSPQFRIHKRHFNLLAASGYRFDSSLVLGKMMGRYDNSGIQQPASHSHTVTEIPIPVLPFLKVPTGLMWCNLLPWRMTKRMLATLTEPVIYLHLFDLIEHKGKFPGNELSAALFYKVASTGVLTTFRKILVYLIENNYTFRTINQGLP